MPQPSEHEIEVFNVALELPAGERAAYLNRVCAEDAALRQRVEELLKANEESCACLESLAAVPPGTGRLSLVPAEKPGDRIGRYKLLQKIGEGGCGVVYMADQEEPVKRRVALKVIKPGMDTKEVLGRFEAERQALALMDHPNIAKVLEAGATETGRPFFVMELVRGIPITRYCDENRLPTQQRLELFIQVCHAIQHAHQKGIIHRDIKPSNILVADHDGVPVPKIIDFGIAKATAGQTLTDKTVFTALEQFIGTPAYMSPEQAKMSALDVDTRSDIYSLGVLLYELLTGKTPFDARKLFSAGLDEIRRVIREEEPQRPSQKLSTLAAEDQTTVARDRQTDSPRLIHLVRGDLDWIVMKCLEKDRTRRYETANGLAADLNRHLENEPAVAWPPSNLYRFQKMVRRNKLAFAAGAMVALALLVGMAMAAWQAVRASRERDAKELALRQAVAAQQEQTRLRQEAQTAERNEARLREQAQAEAYASDMLLAQQAVAANNFSFARELLNRHRPHGKFEKDLRGWEWRYLWQQCTSEALAKVWQAPSKVKVTDLETSRDGKWLAVGQSSDVTAVSILKFVDRTTALLVTNIPARRGNDVSVAFSPVAPLLAFNSTHYEGSRVQPTVHLWNVENGQQLFERPVRSFTGGLAFSPDGSKLIQVLMNFYGTTNGQVLLWSIPDGKVIWSRDASIPRPSPAAAVDDGFRFAAIPGDHLQVIDLTTGKVRWSATNGQFSGAAFTKDGARLFTADGAPSFLRVWDVNSGAPLGKPVPLQRVMGSFLMLSDGRTLVSNTDDGSIHFWDVSDPTQPHLLGRPLRGEGGGIGGMAVSSDGKTVFSGNYDGSVYGWDIHPETPEKWPLAFPGVFDWQFAPDNHSLLTIDPHGHVAQRAGLDFQASNSLFDIGADLIPSLDQADFTDDGELLAVSQQGTIRVWDLTNRSSVPQLVIPGFLGPHSFAPHSKRLVAFKTTLGPLEEWDLETGQKLNSWPTTIQWRQSPLIALSPGAKNVLSVSYDGTEGSMMDAATGHTGHWNNPEAGLVWDVNFAPDGALFSVAGWGGYAQVWETISRRLAMTVGHRQYPFFQTCFSPDGSRLVAASAGPDNLTLWDLGGREMLRLKASGNEFMSLRFSSDGNLLGCIHFPPLESELWLWRAPSWAEIETMDRTVPESQSTNMQKGDL